MAEVETPLQQKIIPQTLRRSQEVQFLSVCQDLVQNGHSYPDIDPGNFGTGSRYSVSATNQ